MSSAEEGRECSRGVACLHRVKLTEQDSGPEHGKGGIMGEIPRGCLVSVAVQLAECWVVPSGRAFQFGAMNWGGGMGREASWDW